MRRRSLRGLVVVFSLLSMPLLAGCEVRTLQIELPGFASGEVDGIWLWKQSAGQWRRVCRIDFENHRITARGEEISYVQNCINGATTRGLLFPTTVRRLPQAPTTIQLEMVYLRYEGPGTYRATAFNESGESPLSSTSLTL